MATNILRRPAVQAKTGRPRSSLYQDIADGLFPAPIRLGVRSSGWPEAEVDAVNAARIAGTPDSELRALVAQLMAARKARQGAPS
jgi:prophage regulatory protein